MSNPLSEESLREKIADPFYAKATMSVGDEPDGGDTWHISKKDFNAYASQIATLILQDRQAWGEMIIGQDEPSQAPPPLDKILMSDVRKIRNELRAEQSQRNTSGSNQSGEQR